MPKRYMMIDEYYYPFCTLNDEPMPRSRASLQMSRWREKGVEFTEEELTEYKKVMADFERWQIIIEKRFGKRMMNYQNVSDEGWSMNWDEAEYDELPECLKARMRKETQR